MWQLSNWKVKLQIKDSTMDALGNFGIRAARFNYQRVLFDFSIGCYNKKSGGLAWRIVEISQVLASCKV